MTEQEIRELLKGYNVQSVTLKGGTVSNKYTSIDFDEDQLFDLEDFNKIS